MEWDAAPFVQGTWASKAIGMVRERRKQIFPAGTAVDDTLFLGDAPALPTTCKWRGRRRRRRSGASTKGRRGDVHQKRARPFVVTDFASVSIAPGDAAAKAGQQESPAASGRLER